MLAFWMSQISTNDGPVFTFAVLDVLFICTAVYLIVEFIKYIKRGKRK